MPARKKVKHGGKREGAGAPIKGGEQRIGATKSERNEYFRNRRAAERGKVTIPNDKTEYSSSGRGRGWSWDEIKSIGTAQICLVAGCKPEWSRG